MHSRHTSRPSRGHAILFGSTSLTLNSGKQGLVPWSPIIPTHWEISPAGSPTPKEKEII